MMLYGNAPVNEIHNMIKLFINLANTGVIHGMTPTLV